MMLDQRHQLSEKSREFQEAINAVCNSLSDKDQCDLNTNNCVEKFSSQIERGQISYEDILNAAKWFRDERKANGAITGMYLGLRIATQVKNQMQRGIFYSQLVKTCLGFRKNKQALSFAKLFVQDFGEDGKDGRIARNQLVGALLANGKTAEAEAAARKNVDDFGEDGKDGKIARCQLVGALLANGKTAEAEAAARKNVDDFGEDAASGKIAGELLKKCQEILSNKSPPLSNEETRTFVVRLFCNRLVSAFWEGIQDQNLYPVNRTAFAVARNRKPGAAKLSG